MRASRKPHLFKLIELAHFRTEDVNDNVAGINQHPVTSFLAFHLGGQVKLFLDTVGQLFGNRRDLPRRAARADHHIVSHVRAAAQVDLHNLFGFVIFNRSQNRGQHVFGSIIRNVAAYARANRQAGGRVRMRQDKVLQIARRCGPGTGLARSLSLQGNNLNGEANRAHNGKPGASQARISQPCAGRKAACRLPPLHISLQRSILQAGRNNGESIMTLFQNLFPRRQSRRDAELAYLNAAVSLYDLERREREIAFGKFAGH